MINLPRVRKSNSEYIGFCTAGAEFLMSNIECVGLFFENSEDVRGSGVILISGFSVI